MRERISITIKKDLLSRVDEMVDGRTIRNRSHAFEFLVSKALKSKIPKVLILAGEESMERVKGKPVIQYILEELKSQKFEEVLIVSVGSEVKKYFGDGKGIGLKIDYIIQKEREGTAKALLLAEKKFEENFITIYGDNIFSFDLMDFFTFHKSQNSTGTVAVTTVKDPKNYGVVSLQGSKIVSFTEKPKKADSYLISSGIFAFSPGIFSKIRGASLERDVLKDLIKERDLSGYVFSGIWKTT